MKSKVQLITLIITPVASVFFVIALFEMFLSYDNYYPQPKRNVIEIEDNKYGFINESNLSFFSEPTPETSDIFVLGDSFAEGVHCAKNKSDFSSRLQTHLGDKFRTHNLAVSGKNTADYMDIVSSLKLDKSDTVLIVLYDNDIHINNQNCVQIQRQALASNSYVPNFCAQDIATTADKSEKTLLQWINNQVKGLKTVQLIKETIVNVPFFSKYFYRTEYIARWNKFDDEETKWMISSIRSIYNIAKSMGADIKFTYYPNTNAINSTDPRHSVWKEFILEVSSQIEVEIDDPYPYFIKNAPQTSMVWSLTDKHPSCEAHDIIGMHISDLIK